MTDDKPKLKMAADNRITPDEIHGTERLVLCIAKAMQGTAAAREQLTAADNQLQLAKMQFDVARGEESGLWKAFLDGENLTPDQAIEQNYGGIRDALQRLTGGNGAEPNQMAEETTSTMIRHTDTCAKIQGKGTCDCGARKD